jgi:hypothetical protein
MLFSYTKVLNIKELMKFNALILNKNITCRRGDVVFM